MEQPISHLTHRAITDHLAIVRNEVGIIAEMVCMANRLSKYEKKRFEPILKQAIRLTLEHSQELADLRRESATNGK